MKPTQYVVYDEETGQVTDIPACMDEEWGDMTQEEWDQLYQEKYFEGCGGD